MDSIISVLENIWRYLTLIRITDVLDIDSTALTWSNTELGKSRINTRSTTVIPCRTLARTTSCVFSTSSTYDMNVLQLGYTFKLSEKRRRWNV